MVANFTTFTNTEKSIDETLKLAKEYIVISVDKINIIKYCRKSILYHNEELWIKKGVSGNFENLMSSFDRAKLSEIIECLLLYNLNYWPPQIWSLLRRWTDYYRRLYASKITISSSLLIDYLYLLYLYASLISIFCKSWNQFLTDVYSFLFNNK